MSLVEDPEIQQVFRPALRPGETLLWAGRPKPGSIDTRFIFHTVFTCAWLLLVFFFASGGFVSAMGSGSPIAISFLIAPLLILAIGLGYLAFTLAGLTAPSRELYAVTDTRVIIYGGRFERTFNSKMKGQISDVMRSGDARTGTLKFRQGQDFGMVSVFWMMSMPMDKFHNIARPIEVEALILDNLFN